MSEPSDTRPESDPVINKAVGEIFDASAAAGGKAGLVAGLAVGWLLLLWKKRK